MNKQEFEKFTDQLFTAFPSLCEWLRQTDNPVGTKGVWYKALATVSYAEAISVLDRWTSGELKAFSAFERDLVATSIKAIVERDRANRTPIAKEIEAIDKYGHRDSYVPLMPILAKAIAMKKQNVSDDDIRAFVDREFPPTPEHSQPRYKCSMCLDKGTIEVWHNTVARAVADGKIPLESATDFYKVACTCSAGNQYTVTHKFWHAMPRYSPDQFCRYRNGPIEVERERLRLWINERQAQPAGDFDDWNGR